MWSGSPFTRPLPLLPAPSSNVLTPQAALIQASPTRRSSSSFTSPQSGMPCSLSLRACAPSSLMWGCLPMPCQSVLGNHSFECHPPLSCLCFLTFASSCWPISTPMGPTPHFLVWSTAARKNSCQTPAGLLCHGRDIQPTWVTYTMTGALRSRF
jgi:hypothetical protein